MPPLVNVPEDQCHQVMEEIEWRWDARSMILDPMPEKNWKHSVFPLRVWTWYGWTPLVGMMLIYKVRKDKLEMLKTSQHQILLSHLDDSTFKDILRFIGDQQLLRVKAIIWNILPNVRKDALLSKQARLIDLFKPRDIWHNVLIICKQSRNPEDDAQGFT